MTDRRQFLELVRYGVIGILQNGVFYAIGVGLSFAGLRAWQAAMLTYPVAVLAGFYFNRVWTFRASGKARRQLLKYIGIYVLIYPLALVMNWGLEMAGLRAWQALLLTTVLGAISIFFALKIWVFPSSEPRK